METEENNTIEAALSVEQGQAKEDQIHEYVLASAHTIDHDSWKQVGLMLVTSFNCGYILSFSNLILVPMGWTWGIICLLLVGLFTAYANWLLAGFNFINGQRFIRYRDLMGFLYGRKKTVLYHLDFPILDPCSWEHGIHTSWRKGTQVDTKCTNETRNQFGVQLFSLEAPILRHRHRSHLLLVRIIGSNNVGNEKMVGSRYVSYLRLSPYFWWY
ncbi:unnamed protein product [Ilex paraguariensis]|uniref:Amino acid transporter transmembrane domain-containing protein n=1 Tax=Ilex paraguariensis TaxID=185542 RepID=A0ABC8RG52_9AQUA